MLFKGLFVRPFEATARASSPLLAGDGALGLAQGGGPGGEGCQQDIGKGPLIVASKISTRKKNTQFNTHYQGITGESVNTYQQINDLPNLEPN